MRFSTSVVLAVLAAASVPAFATPLEARRVRSGGSRLEKINNVVGIADGLSGIATNIYGYVDPS